jgi:hypothetical protein
MTTSNDLFRLPRSRERSPIAAINKGRRARRAEQIRLVACGIEVELNTVRDYICATRQSGRNS